MSKAEEKAGKACPINKGSGIDRVMSMVNRKNGYIQGYMQAEKDLALTTDDIKKIVDIYDECLSLTFEEGKPAYESEEFYKEALDRFLKSKEK